MALPPEICQECQKEISRRARANVIGERVVCTACWHKLDAARREDARWDGPASVAQTGYAADLGLSVPDGATWGDAHDILTRHLDYDGDPQAPDWLINHARALGLAVSRFAGLRQVSAKVFGHLADAGNVPLAEWFAFNVAREMKAQVSQAFIAAAGAALASDPKVMKSIRKYDGADLADFGEVALTDGSFALGGSKQTIAYKAAAALLRQHG